jgi:hypothetical protein
MSVAISPAPSSATPAKPADAAQPKDAAETFGQLVEGAAATVAAAVEPASEVPAPAPTPTDATLEAVLQSLRAALVPGAAVLPGKARAKAGDVAKPQTEEPAKDGEAESKPTEAMPAFSLAQLLPIVAAPKSEKAAEAIDDVIANAITPPKLPVIDVAGLAALVKAPDAPSFDLSAVRAPDLPSPVTAQLDRLVDTARDAAWLDRLSQDIAASAGTGDRLKFKMMPPNLGALDVAVERQAAGMHVTMTTHTADARNLIADARQQMIDSLKAQGVPLVQLSLSTAGEEPPGHRPPTFFSQLIEAAPASGTDLAAQPVETTTAGRVGRFA